MKYALVASVIVNSVVVLGHFANIHFTAPSAAHFKNIVANDTFDFGCRPIAHPTQDGQFQLSAILEEDQIAFITKELENEPEIKVKRAIQPRQSNSAPIGTGDRFSAGTVSPVGLGTRPSGSTISGGLMNVKEIKSAFDALVRNYGVGSVTLPNKTFNGATQFAGFVGAGTDKSKYRLYLSAGVHARERGGPDNLLYWISDLLLAKKNGSGLTYGRKSYTNAQVNSVLNAGIVFFPLVNPDGVVFDQANGNLWRKNRNTRSGSSGGSVGVDINRNFDFLWDFPKHFDSRTSPASTSPSSQTFRGVSAASEPETKNHVSLYDTFPKIRWMMDIHSAVGDLLYSWGDDDNGSNEAMNFRNSAYDGKRGVTDDNVYREYIPAQDATNSRTVADKMVAGMSAVGGRDYGAVQAVGLYATSGATDDYAFSRFWAKPGSNKVYAYTLEFGPSGNFYPTTSEFNTNILDTNAGFMEWALAAIAVGLD